MIAVLGLVRSWRSSAKLRRFSALPTGVSYETYIGRFPGRHERLNFACESYGSHMRNAFTDAACDMRARSSIKLKRA